MDARIYFTLSDCIGAADSAPALDAMRDVVSAKDCTRRSGPHSRRHRGGAPVATALDGVFDVPI